MRNTPILVERPDDTICFWTRVSTKGQAADGISLDQQYRRLSGVSQRQGWREVNHFVGRGESAFQGDRDEFRAFLLYMRQNPVLYAGSEYVDRFTRDLETACAVVRASQLEGWKLVILQMKDEPLDFTDYMQWSQFMLFAWVAELESRMKSSRGMEVMAEVKKDPTKKLGRARLDPQLLGLMRRMRSAGHSYGSIAAHLNAKGYATTRGAPQWTATTVGSIVRRAEGNLCPSEYYRPTNAERRLKRAPII